MLVISYGCKSSASIYNPVTSPYLIVFLLNVRSLIEYYNSGDIYVSPKSPPSSTLLDISQF